MKQMRMILCLLFALLLCACNSVAPAVTVSENGEVPEDELSAEEIAGMNEPDPTPMPDPTATPEPVREADADTLVTVETVQGEASVAQGYAVPSGETLTTGLGGVALLVIGGDNCLVLSENTSVQLFRYGELLEAHLLSGTMSWYLPAPETMPFALLYCNEALTADLNSICGYMQYDSPNWGIIRPYLGTVTLHLMDNKTMVVEDGASAFTQSEGHHTSQSGSFEGKLNSAMHDLLDLRREAAAALANGYGVEETALLFSVGIRTEPEVIRTDYPDRDFYTIKIIDTNGDVAESGYFNLDDSIRQYDVYTYENHLLVRTEHQEPGASRDGMIEMRTYYPSGELESVTQLFTDGTGRTSVYDEHDRQIATVETKDGEVTFRRDTTYVPWDENAKDSENMRYVSVQAVSYTGYAALGTTEGYISTETYDERGQQTESFVTQLDGTPIRRFTRTYYENGQVATECLEQYFGGTRSYTTYDENGNQTGYEFTEQTGN